MIGTDRLFDLPELGLDVPHLVVGRLFEQHSPLAASGDARSSSSSLRCVAACSRPWVCWMTKSITSVIAEVPVSNPVNQPDENPTNDPTTIPPISAIPTTMAAHGNEL